MDYFKIEAAAKAAFSDQYPDAYLQRLEAVKNSRDFTELLWVAFAHGYAEGMSKAASLCDAIAENRPTTRDGRLIAQECAVAIREG